ncbi:peptidase M4 family protein [Sciscionella marina]|uniref:peptidase M4 family protein n=1 Tax=Sciscionella marina TaxID=508770 RepID=UPI00037CF3CD|nr:peptidase M4 family protein [Sciscionella marina]
MVEWHANNAVDKPDYLIGELLNLRGDDKPLRYMDKPAKDGRSLDNWSSGAGNTDVHYSSGIANHFFSLLAEGGGSKVIDGVRYDSPAANDSAVTGIGRDKAAQIWYTALTKYFVSTTNYRSARQATIQAANDLYGSGSTEATTVAAA